MKKLLITSLFAAVATCALADYDKHDSDRGFYFGGSLGAGYQTDRETTLSSPPNQQRLTLSTNTGIVGSLYAGYKWDLFRYELEALYLRNKHDEYLQDNVQFDSMTATFVSTSGFPIKEDARKSYTQKALMFNVIHDIDIHEKFGFYVGAGLGIVRVNSDMESLIQNNTIVSKISSTTAAYQFLGGLAYHWNEQVDLNLGYRFFRTEKNAHDLHTNLGVFDAHKNPINHSLSLGVRYKL